MKSNKIIGIIALLSATIFSSCSKETLSDKQVNVNKIYEITAFNGDAMSKTKTTIADDETTILWNPGDAINVFYGSASVKFTSINTEPEACTIFSSSSSLIYGDTESSSEYIWAVYPYSSNSKHDKTSVSLQVPSDQYSVIGSYSEKAFPSIGRSKDTNIAFYNVCGGIRFSISQPGVKRVVFSGNNNEIIAGTVKVGFNEDERPVVTEVISGSSSITLFSSSKGFDVGKWYYISMLPVKLENGFKMSFYTNDYSTSSEKSAFLNVSSSKEVERSIFGEIENADENLVYALRIYSIRLNKSELYLEPSSTDQLSYTINPTSATYDWINWYSSDDNVATVDQNGVVTGVSSGTCTISVKSDNGHSASCTVYVSSPSATTEDATDIGFGSADIKGSLYAPGISNCPKTAVFLYSSTYNNLEDLISYGLSTSANLWDSSDGNYVYNKLLTGLQPNTTYYYVIKSNIGYYPYSIYYGDVKSFTTNNLPELQDGVIDLGLSVNWSSTNVGANLPEECGYLYAWGEVETKESYRYDNYKWIREYSWESDDDAGGSTYVNKYGSSDYTYADPHGDFSEDWCNDGKTVLDYEDDAARVEWRGTWRMPTSAECQELIHNCQMEDVVYKNVRGLLLTSKIPGYTDKRLFLPYSSRSTSYSIGGGYYSYGSYSYLCCWSSTQELAYPIRAMAITESGVLAVRRHEGLPIRPVKNK